MKQRRILRQPNTLTRVRNICQEKEESGTKDCNLWRFVKAMAVRDPLLSFSFPASDPLYFVFHGVRGGETW